MVKLIMGLKGSGKTKQLVTDINEAVKNETGSMVCIEKGTKLRYDIDIRVRLIDYQEYSMGTLTFLKGLHQRPACGQFRHQPHLHRQLLQARRGGRRRRGRGLRPVVR